MDAKAAEAFFIEHLGTIDRVLSSVCRRHSMQHADSEDFCSGVKLKLIENEYAIVRKFEGRSFAAYIAVVIHRMLLDYRIHFWGKWHASSEARKQGEVGIALEVMLVRDGRSVDEALPALRRIRPDLSLSEAQALAAVLPSRMPRTRFVHLGDVVDDLAISADSIEDVPAARERARMWYRIREVVQAYFNGLEEEDRRTLRLRFGGGLSVADIARALGVDQKPLYRQLDRHIAALRKRLQLAGIRWEAARELLEHPADEIDFHFMHTGMDKADNLEES